jgi:hypothetical protein
LSKERHSSIATETLKKLNFDINWYIKINRLIKLILNIQDSLSLVIPIKGYESWKICLTYEKKRKHTLEVTESKWKLNHRIQCVRELICRGFKLTSVKTRNFAFFAQRKITDACFFSQGWSYRTNCARTPGEGPLKRKIKVIVPFLSSQKDGRAPRSPLTPLFPQNRPIKTLR